MTARNRCVTASPRIASVYPQLHSNQSSRRNSIQKNSKPDSSVKSHHSKSVNVVDNSLKQGSNIVITDDNNVSNSDAQNTNEMKNLNNICSIDIQSSDSAIQNDRTVKTDDKKTCDKTQESKESNDSGFVDSINTDMSVQEIKNDENLNSSKSCDTENKSSQGSEIDVENQSSRSITDDSPVINEEINRNIKDMCNNCCNDTQRQSTEGSENVQGCLDVSNDSGLYSTKSSFEMENSPPSHHKTEDTSDFSPEQETANSQSKNLPIVLEDMPAQQKSNPHNCEMKLPSNGVTNSPKSSLWVRSISEDVNGVSMATDNQTSRARPLSTDEALSEYAKSKNKPAKMVQPFNPFPVKHFNENRKKNCVKLGLYKTSTLQEFERQCKSKYLWSK